MADNVGEETPLQLPSSLSRFSDSRDYEQQVLSLEEGTAEQDLDEEYIQDAQDVGIEMLASPTPAIDSASSWLSTNTLSTTPPRRSASTDSRLSCSTGLTSNFSRASTDHYYTTHPYHLRFRSLSRPSLFETELDGSAASVTPDRSETCLPVTPANAGSTTSLPLPQISAGKPFSVRRGLSRLSKLTKVANTSRYPKYVHTLHYFDSRP